MKKLNFNDFSTQKISLEEQEQVTGGNSINIFCEWYVGVTGGNTNPQIMAIMMMFDQGLSDMYDDWLANQP